MAFKPTRTNYTSVARLQFTSNSDDAVERVLIAATSTGQAIATVGGDVPSLLALSLPTQPGSFGTFQPTVAKHYETAAAATVTTTAGNATLSVSDPGPAAPGHLVNGTFSLPPPLNVRAINASNTTQAFAPLPETAGTPLSLLTYAGPGQPGPGHARLPPGDRLDRRAALRQLRQDADVHAVHHRSVEVRFGSRRCTSRDPSRSVGAWPR